MPGAAPIVLSDCTSAQLFYGPYLCQTEPWKTMCCGGGPSGAAVTPAAPSSPPGSPTLFAAASASAAAPAGGGGGCGACRGCGGGGAGPAAVGTVGGVVQDLFAAAERPGPAGIAWWIWVIVALIVLNLLRS